MPTSPTSPESRPRRRSRLRLYRWISPVVLLLLWQAASSTGLLPSSTLASPSTLVRTTASLIADGELRDAFLVSGQRAAIGFVVGALAGLALGVAAGLSRWTDGLLDPPLQMLRTLPLLGLSPLLIIWFGIGEAPKIVLVALGTAFPMYLNTHSGVKGTDRQLLETARVLGFTRWQRLWHVVLPSALPSTLVGLRQSLGIAWLTLVVAEQINANAGLGELITNAAEFLRDDIVVVGLIVYAVLGLVTDALVRLLERRLLRWRTG
ncbi:MAG TPA: ABC transporter permease [Pseudonocardiaceae bacterium]|nr:ABC transporter permease [Pseudonocardiaceae bacterium]